MEENPNKNISVFPSIQWSFEEPNRQVVDYIDLSYDFVQKNQQKGSEIIEVMPYYCNETAVQQAMIDILMTRIGEREFMPTYGSQIYYLMFEPMNQFTKNSLELCIRNALENWEPRIEVQEIEITYSNNTWYVTIHYKVLRINQLETLEISFDKIG